MTLGAFFVQTGVLGLEPVLAAVPVALLIAALLYINQFQDYTADKAVGKNHLVVRLGKRKAMFGYAVLMVSTYVSVILFVALDLISQYTLLVLISLPLAIQGLYYARKYYSSSTDLVPANALAVISHLMIGILLIVGYAFESVGSADLVYLILTIIIFGVIIALFNLSIQRQKKAHSGLRESAG
jgi:1,4-dihydroxy-2-naphthoate octaprenyltransferase